MSKYTFKELIELVESNPWLYESITGNAPSNDNMICKAQDILGVSFPEAYKNVLLRWGDLQIGIGEGCMALPRSLDTLVVPQALEPSEKIKLLGYVDNVVSYTLYVREESNLPDYYLVIYDDEGDEYGCIDARSPEGEVVVWDFFEQEVARSWNKSFIDYMIELFIWFHDMYENFHGYSVVWPKSLREKMKSDFLRIQKELDKDDDFLPDWCK